MPKPPPIPPDADLRDFGFLPLHPQKLRDSRFHIIATDAEFRAWIMLLCAAWHQLPAGSLPTDERELAFLAGFGRNVDDWRAVGEMKLYGWEECSDGRLYNDVFAEDVLNSWKAKQANQKRTKAATKARAEKRDVQRDVQRDDARDVHQGKGRKGKGSEENNPNVTTSPARAQEALSPVDRHKARFEHGDDFERFKAVYPERSGTQPWRKAMDAATDRRKEGHDFAAMIAGAERYHRYTDATGDTGTKFVMQAATFLGPEKHFTEPWDPPKSASPQRSSTGRFWDNLREAARETNQ